MLIRNRKISFILLLTVVLGSLAVLPSCYLEESSQIPLVEEQSQTPSGEIRDTVDSKEEMSQEEMRLQALELQKETADKAELEGKKFKENLIETANRYAEKRRYGDAISAIDSLLAVDPDDEVAKYLKNSYEAGHLWQQEHGVAREGDKNVVKLLIDADAALIQPAPSITYPDGIDGKQQSYEYSQLNGVPLRDLRGRGGMGGGAGGGMGGGMGFDRSINPNVLIDSSGRVIVNADEVWVIARGNFAPAGEPYDTPGSGSCVVRLPGATEDVPLPLKHTDVSGKVAGYVSTVEVTQQFHNPYDTKIEAKYVFPLPENAAVNDFIMTIGERTIRGIIREKEQAKQIYEQARNQGHVASLLTQQRPNIFTQQVANIEPGKSIDINIKYFNTLTYKDGWYEFVFPMVVGPRFNPPHTTDGVGAVANGSRAGSSGQSTEVAYLKPNQRSGHDISLAVTIDAGVKIEDLECTSHVIEKNYSSDNCVNVSISKNDTIPNKDFVLRYKVVGNKVKTGIMTTTDANGTYFSMMLYPPESISKLKRVPMEMIFVLDCSGSMNGWPMEISKQAIRRAVKRLGPDDSFQIIRFSNNASQLGPKPLIASKDNIDKALNYLDTLNGSGGTMMIEGIKAALDFEHDPERFRIVTFLTDGYIGNEDEILKAINDKLGASRIFSFGIGSSPNRYLLDRMAVIGKGAVSYIGTNDSPVEPIDAFYETLAHPALTDIQIEYGNMEATEVWPQQIPDLFVGRAVVVTGKCNNVGSSNIIVRGRVGSMDQEYAVKAEFSDKTAHEGIAAIWARKKIETLKNILTVTTDRDIPATILKTALDYNLMSDYTSFVAVDSSTVTKGDHGISVVVPVPVPEGVRYDTTVR